MRCITCIPAVPVQARVLFIRTSSLQCICAAIDTNNFRCIVNCIALDPNGTDGRNRKNVKNIFKHVTVLWSERELQRLHMDLVKFVVQIFSLVNFEILFLATCGLHVTITSCALKPITNHVNISLSNILRACFVRNK